MYTDIYIYIYIYIHIYINVHMLYLKCTYRALLPCALHTWTTRRLLEADMFAATAGRFRLHTDTNGHVQNHIYMYKYIYMLHMQMCIYECIYTGIYTHIWLFEADVFAATAGRFRLHIDTHVNDQSHTYLYIYRLHMHMYIWMYIHRYVYTYMVAWGGHVAAGGNRRQIRTAHRDTYVHIHICTYMYIRIDVYMSVSHKHVYTCSCLEQL